MAHKVVVPEGVTAIEDEKYKHSRIEEIVLPSTLKKIGKEAFAYCGSLTSVTFPEKVDFIGSGAFRDCGAKIERPAQTGSFGFEMNSATLEKYSGKETDVTIPDGVQKIAGKAFYGNGKIKSITIPASVTAIAAHAIEHCPKLESIVVDKDNKRYRVEGNCVIDIKKNTAVVCFDKNKK